MTSIFTIALGACSPENSVSRYYHDGTSIGFMPSDIVKACRVPGDDVVPLVSTSGKYDKTGSDLVADAKQYEDSAFETLTDGITLDDLQTSAAPFTVLAYWHEISEHDGTNIEFAQLAITPDDNRAAIYAAFDDSLSIVTSYNAAVSSMPAYPELPTKVCSAYESRPDDSSEYARESGEKLGGSVYLGVEESQDPNSEVTHEYYFANNPNFSDAYDTSINLNFVSKVSEDTYWGFENYATDKHILSPAIAGIQTYTGNILDMSDRLASGAETTFDPRLDNIYLKNTYRYGLWYCHDGVCE